MKEPPKNWEGSFLDINKYVELIDNSLQSGTDLGFKSVSDNKVSIIQTVDSKSNFEKEPEVDFCFSFFFFLIFLVFSPYNSSALDGCDQLMGEYFSVSICRDWIGSFQRHPR